MNEAEKKKYLAEIRKQEADWVKQAKKAFPVSGNIPKLGSFQEDDPETHQSFFTPRPEEK